MRVKYINPQGLPEHYARAVQLIREAYDKGDADFSVTELCSPPRIRTLKRRDVEVALDVADESHAIAGSAMHFVLEVLRNDPDYIIEQRLIREFEGVRISGMLDGFFRPSAELFDWKGTRWATYSDGVKLEYAAQLNINRWLLRGPSINYDTGQEFERLEVNKLSSTAMFRDYSKITAPHKPPHLPVQSFDVPIWSDDFLHEFLRTRITLMRQAEMNLPQCSDAEVWATKPKWAVEPVKGGRSLKNCSSPEEAEERRQKAKNPNGYIVVHRPGSRPRCRHYCEVASICDVWQNHPTNPINGGDDS